MKTKTKKKLKKVHHTVTKKKLVKKKTSQRTLRGFFIIVATVCFGGLGFAIATTKPTVSVEVHSKIQPGTTLAGDTPVVPPPNQVGQASWYALGLPQPDALTCASTRFGRGTYLMVTDKRTGRIVTCLVNDYGPASWTGRVIDLSRGSFRVVDDLSRGTAPVEVRVVTAPPTSLNGLNFDIKDALSTIMGYNLCQSRHNANFCEANRQKEVKL